MKPLNKKKVVNIDENVYNTLKTYCVEKGIKIKWLVEKLINDYIKENNENK